MKALIAVVLFGVLAGLALLHFQWGRGSHWPAASAEALVRSVVGDGRRRMPGPVPCFVVAALLLALALWPLLMLEQAMDGTVQRVSVIIAGIFVARGVAGFTPRWRAFFHDEPFTTLDKRYYSPFCILIGMAFVAFASGGFGR